MKNGISGASALSGDFDARLPTLDAAVNGKQVFAHPPWTSDGEAGLGEKSALTKKLTFCFTLGKSFYFRIVRSQLQWERRRVKCDWFAVLLFAYSFSLAAFLLVPSSSA